MATQRYISTSFWDDRWIRSLNPADRYLYLYLMTNPLTNIAGVYEITMDRIAFDTGYDERTLRPMLDRFAEAGKAVFFHDEWMILPRWPKHQRVKKGDNVKKGIDRILADLPGDVFQALYDYGYDYEFIDSVRSERASKGLEGAQSPFESETSPSNYSDLDLDLDLDSDLDSHGETHKAPDPPKNKPSKRKGVPRADMTHPTLDVPMNSTTYGKLCKTFGQATTDRYVQKALDHIARNRPSRPYADYAAAARQYMEGDNLQPPPKAENKVCPDCGSKYVGDYCAKCGWEPEERGRAS